MDIMCGIVGYTGSQEAAPILLDGLKKLEYRGYDSAGVAVLHGHQIAVSKVTGRIANLCEKTDDGKNCPGTETIFTAAVEIVPLQLLAYYVARENSCDIDKPKNLAKSVTVE